MLLDILYTLLLLGGIVFFCQLFTNAIEWLGHHLNLSDGVVGSVLAAVGTALPETLVPIVAILSGVFSAQSGLSVEASHDIGVGAILGAPFMLATLAMLISALAVLIFAKLRGRSTRLHIDRWLLRDDFLFFFPAFGVAVASTWLPPGELRFIPAVVLLGIYGCYLKYMFSKPDDPNGQADTDLHPLTFAPKASKPTLRPIVIQTGAGLLGIMAMAHLFVHEIEHISSLLKLNPLIVSLIIVPIATELPEKFNSVVWIGEKKDQLAFGNLTGAMVFQSCIPTAIGVAFTPWSFTPAAWASVFAAMASSALISLTITYLPERFWVWSLLLGGLFYVAFVAFVLSQMASGLV
jgi:cation:H+ antiporter